MKYADLTIEEKDILIKLATDAGYGCPEYTNHKEIDYKFWEDTDYEESVCLLVKEITILKQVIHKAYVTANNTIYFNDSSDNVSALYDVCSTLKPLAPNTGETYIEE